MVLDWVIAAVLGIALFFVFEPIYLKMSFSVPKKKLSLLFKALATTMTLTLTVLGYLRSPDTFGLLMMIAMGICLVADILIGVNFIVGVFAFLLGHLFFIPAFLQTYNPRWFFSVSVFVFGLLLVWFLFHNYFKTAGDKCVPCLVYSVILSAMLALGVPAFLTFDTRGTLLAAGAVLFVTSDLTLARSKFIKRTQLNDTISLTLYYMAQFLFGLSVFVPTIAK